MSDDDHVFDLENEDGEAVTVEIHWQHPRHELEHPVLLILPSPSRVSWVADIINTGVAAVVVREELYRDEESGEVEKRAERIAESDEIPAYIADALLEYNSNYGPIDEVVNPVDRDDETPPADVNYTFDDYTSPVDENPDEAADTGGGA